MSLWINDSGAWKEATPWINDGGTWKTLQGVHVNDNGIWKSVYVAATLVNDFEDGTVQGWTTRYGTNSAHSGSNVIAGSYSLNQTFSSF